MDDCKKNDNLVGLELVGDLFKNKKNLNSSGIMQKEEPSTETVTPEGKTKRKNAGEKEKPRKYTRKWDMIKYSVLPYCPMLIKLNQEKRKIKRTTQSDSKIEIIDGVSNGETSQDWSNSEEHLPIVVKEKLEIDRKEYVEVKLEDEEKPETMEQYYYDDNDKNESPVSKQFEKQEMKFNESTIVVKEELEIGRNEYVEVKLEDEKKPETIDQSCYYDIEKEKDLAVFGNFEEQGTKFDEKNLHKCFYCGDYRTSKEMAKLPKTQAEFSKWYLILGEIQHEKLTTSSMICRSHFIDEFGDSRLVDEVCNGVVVNTKIGRRWNCCYCKSPRMIFSMTRIPKDERIFAKWVNILGKTFHDNAQIVNNGFICRNHFDTKWKRQRPKMLLPIANSMQNLTEKKQGGVLPTFSFDNVKLEVEPGNKGISNRKSTHFLNNNIKSEKESQKMETHIKIEEVPTVIKQENFTIEDNTSESKFIKTKVKEEE